MDEPTPDAAHGAALFEVAKLVVSGCLTLGAVFLTAFGLIERVVGFERLASDPRFALAALLPGGAALAFLGGARAVGAIYDMTVPARPIGLVQRVVKRAAALSGAYGLFALVLSALISVSVGLAVQLLAADIDRRLIGAATVAIAAFLIALSGLLTRASKPRAALDGALVVVVLGTMLLDHWL